MPRDGIVAASREGEHDPRRGADGQRQGVDGLRLRDVGHGVVEARQRHPEGDGTPLIGRGIRRGEGDGAGEAGFGGGPVMLVRRGHHAEGGVGLGE